MEQKIFMVLQISKPDSKARKYADGIFECIRYGLNELKNFMENGAQYYAGMSIEYEKCREEIASMKINLVDEYYLERHDLDNTSSDLLQDLVKRLSKGYCGYIVLLDTDKEIENHGEIPYTNANVFFEYGVLRAQGKRIALLKQENTKLPWDICVDNATNIPVEILELVKKEIIEGNDVKKVVNAISESDKLTKIKIFMMTAEILGKLFAPFPDENTFSSVLDRMEMQDAGFDNYRQVLEKVTMLFNVLDVKKLLEGSMASYLNTEEKAFNALTEAVNKAKKSIRTTRFANQSIVKQPNENEVTPAQEFMEALYDATKRNPNLLCYRIVCNNNADKWWDIYQTLINSNSNMNIFVCKQQYDIHFEIVVIDEEITFLHFYQTSEDGHTDGSNESDGTKVRKIQSTLRITNETVSKEFAKVFDRLHHRERDSMSRRLLQIGGNAEDIESEFEGMMLQLENTSNPEMDAQILLLEKWKEYKRIYDKQSEINPNNMDKLDYINFTTGLIRKNTEKEKGCGIFYDDELKEAYKTIESDVREKKKTEDIN